MELGTGHTTNDDFVIVFKEWHNPGTSSHGGGREEGGGTRGGE